MKLIDELAGVLGMLGMAAVIAGFGYCQAQHMTPCKGTAKQHHENTATDM